MYEPDSTQTNAVQTGGVSTPHSAAILVIGSLIALVLIKKGFRGVNLGGVKVGV